MAYFPERVMPKDLARETSAEVDGSPLIYNATEYNRHHREIRAIERFLVGTAGSEASGFSGYFDGSGFSSFSGWSGESLATSGLVGVISEVENLLARIADDGLLTSVAGYVIEGGRIPIPAGVASAEITGPVGASDSSISCPLASLFPKRGYMTKFNAVNTTDHCTTNVQSFSGSCSSGELYKDYEPFVDASLGGSPVGHVTNQEFIWYDYRTEDSFESCTRGADGTTAQDLASGEVAILVPGRASLMLSSYAWAKGGDPAFSGFSGFRQFMVGHGSNLLVEAGGFSGAIEQVNDYYSVGYCLTVTPNFDDVSVSSAYEV